MAIYAKGHEAISFTGPQAGVRTNSVHRKARIQSINPDKVKKALSKGKIVIVAGFQGATLDDDITTLSRGGSDTSAVALAAALKADVCEIYTDVEGIYTADPRIVKDVKRLDSISSEEMLEMASLGAKVLHTRAVEYAEKYDVPVHVRSTFSENPGTMVTKEVKDMEGAIIKGVTHDKDQAKISVYGVPDTPGMAYKIFKAVGDAEINVDVIVQNVGRDNKANISFTVSGTDLKEALAIVQSVGKNIGVEEITADNEIAKVSLVGVGMKSHSGVAARMFEALAEKKINIQMITTSEIKISCVIAKKDTEEAVRAIHSKFLG